MLYRVWTEDDDGEREAWPIEAEDIAQARAMAVAAHTHAWRIVVRGSDGRATSVIER